MLPELDLDQFSPGLRRMNRAARSGAVAAALDAPTKCGENSDGNLAASGRRQERVDRSLGLPADRSGPSPRRPRHRSLERPLRAASPLGDKTRMVRLSSRSQRFHSALAERPGARRRRPARRGRPCILLRGGEQPPVVTCSSLDGSGLDDIWQIVVERTREQERSGALKAQRRAGRETGCGRWSMSTSARRCSRPRRYRRAAEHAEGEVRIGALPLAARCGGDRPPPARSSGTQPAGKPR